jgi:hypothetical protein
METVDRVSASNGFFYGHLWVFQDWLLSFLLYLFDVSTTYPAIITSLRYELRVSESLPCKTLHVARTGRVFAQVDTYI